MKETLSTFVSAYIKRIMHTTHVFCFNNYLYRMTSIMRAHKIHVRKEVNTQSIY